MSSQLEIRRPLKPLVLEILLSLSGSPNHGYAMMKEIEDRTGGRVPARPGAFYRTVGRMMEDELIRELEERPPCADGHDPRRRYYALTQTGRAVARAELERLAAAAARGRARGLL